MQLKAKMRRYALGRAALKLRALWNWPWFGDRFTKAQFDVGNVGDNYFTAGDLQFEILKEAGCTPNSHVLEVGCGALVAGRLVIPWLDADRYVGIDPNRWLFETAISKLPDFSEVVARKRPVFLTNEKFDASETGRKFDFCISHSILSHAAHWQLPIFCQNVGAVMRPGGTILASIRMYDAEGKPYGDSLDKKWVYPDTSSFAWATVESAAHAAGLKAANRPDLKQKVIARLPSNAHDWVEFTA